MVLSSIVVNVSSNVWICCSSRDIAHWMVQHVLSLQSKVWSMYDLTSGVDLDRIPLFTRLCHFLCTSLLLRHRMWFPTYFMKKKKRSMAVNQSVCQLFSKYIHRSINQPINQLINQFDWKSDHQRIGEGNKMSHSYIHEGELKQKWKWTCLIMLDIWSVAALQHKIGITQVFIVTQHNREHP